jgi:nitric oxide reductase NorQ protein
MSAEFKCPHCGEPLKSKQHAASHLWSHHGVRWSEFLKQYPDFSSLATAPPTSRTQRILNDYASPTASSTPPAPTPQPAQVEDDVKFYDWGGFLDTLMTAYKAGLFVLIIGPKGTGKTTLVRAFAKKLGKPLYSINFSLRTRESHLVGTMMMENGTTKFALGIIPKSMEEGAILYLDELNAAEADVLLRLDEALDDRRQLVIKEAGNPITIKAREGWFVIATINPLSHAGTKELPPQLLSRFPVRIYMDYPPEDVVIQIVKMHVGELTAEQIKYMGMVVEFEKRVRQIATETMLPYTPSLRETIAFAKLLKSGVDAKTAVKLVYVNAYYQWGGEVVQKIEEAVGSIFGY